MTYRRWLTLSILCMAAMTLAVCASSYAIDIFGVFRDTRGRTLHVYNNERTGKYLLNQRYVPQNYQALLIGSSLSANWDVSAVAGPRMYNESMDGANATEEKLLVDQALPAGHFVYALCVLSPAITADHTLKEAGMGTPSRAEALGSVTILREEIRMEWDRLRHHPPGFFADGSKVLQARKMDRAWLPAMWAVDPEGVRDYDALLAELRGRGIKIIFVDPPMAAPVFAQRQDALNRYQRAIAVVHEGEAVIDFNSPEYTSFRDDSDNYYDDVHLTPQGARTLSRALNGEIDHVLAEAKAK